MAVVEEDSVLVFSEEKSQQTRTRCPTRGGLKTTLPAISMKDQQIDEDKVRNMTEKLNITLEELKIKKDSFGQHSKVCRT